MNDIHQDCILILDFGSQYSQLIARRIRELGVYCELHPYDMSDETIKSLNPNGIILSGGPQTVTQIATPRAPQLVFELGIPVLGICYGMQTMAAQLGGGVESSSMREFGAAKVRMHSHSDLLINIEDETTSGGQALLDVWMSHGDKVTQLPDGFELICETDNAPIAGMYDATRQFYGLQFHPEVTHTKQGMRIIKRFAITLCKCRPLWTAGNIIDDAIASVCTKVGNDKVILGLSGGVDSSVVAVLLQKAIGSQLTCVFVDTGLLRKNEANQVMTMFGQHLGIEIIHVNAQNEFLDALKGIDCPEQKRKIMGNKFIEIFDRESKKLQGVKWLAQGTIYPDVIESAHGKTGTATVIKSHHNVGGLPEKMDFQLIEPLRDLFKDEVRKIGLELGLPHDMVYRHPFPGPGLGVRILGEVKKAYADILRQADEIFINELFNHDLYHKVSQAFAVFLPVKSVGVMGDARKYDYVICLRAVETIDFMTAHWAQLPHDFLAHVSNRIINEVQGVSRVAYDISGKPPATIEWE
jgi:GMP synthase (glutamine-hydrolysing)